MSVLLKGILDQPSDKRRASRPIEAPLRLQPSISCDASSGHVETDRLTARSIASGRTVQTTESSISIKFLEEKPTQPPTLFKKFKTIFKRFKLRRLVPLIFIGVYMLIGSLIFLWFENGPDKRKQLEEYRFYINEKILFLKRMEEIFLDEASSNELWRKRFTTEAIDYFHDRIGLRYSNESRWSFSAALYYSGTIFTTIGYGDIACDTSGGRLMTVIYAVFGIPLMLVTLNDLGKFLYSNINAAIKWYGKLVTKLKARIRGVRDQDVESLESQSRCNRRVNVQYSLESEENLSISEKNLLESGESPRMHVLVAIGITVGWIFFCASLFNIWEKDWTYAESCYFMFISLSTIGLGDLAVKRKDLMVLCFIFVIIGLSLVSMCVNVIQAALEDLYVKILMKLLIEYQSKLAEGSDRKGASIGMMQMWGKNRSAKYLMPLLSKDRRMVAMTKLQETAEASGIEIPSILTDIDQRSGLPRAFGSEQEIAQCALEEALCNDIKKRSLALQTTPNYFACDNNTQTDFLICIEKGEQAFIDTTETSVATDSCSQQYTDTFIQTIEPEIKDSYVQTTTNTYSSVETMTYKPSYVNSDVQTECVLTMDQELQTYISNLKNIEVQTDSPEYNSVFVQSNSISFIDTEVQTNNDWTKHDDEHERSRITNARNRVRRAFGINRTSQMVRRQSADPIMSTWTDPQEEDEIESTPESDEMRLDWDPVDGMHAERQRPVRDLAKLFESGTRKSLRQKKSLHDGFPNNE